MKVHEGRALLSFDLSLIPANATVESATLEMHYTGLKGLYSKGTYVDAYDTEGSFTIHRMTKNWEETNDTKWATHNSSYIRKAEDTYDYLPGSVSWADFDVTAAVQSMVKSPEDNCGFMIITHSPAADTTKTYWEGLRTHWASSDTSDITLRPKLTIDYTLNTEVAMASFMKRKFVSVGVHDKVLSISYPHTDIADVTLLTPTGRAILTETGRVLNKGVNSVTLADGLATGVYFLHIAGEELSVVEPLVISK